MVKAEELLRSAHTNMMMVISLCWIPGSVSQRSHLTSECPSIDHIGYTYMEKNYSIRDGSKWCLINKKNRISLLLSAAYSKYISAGCSQCTLTQFNYNIRRKIPFKFIFDVTFINNQPYFPVEIIDANEYITSIKIVYFVNRNPDTIFSVVMIWPEVFLLYVNIVLQLNIRITSEADKNNTHFKWHTSVFYNWTSTLKVINVIIIMVLVMIMVNIMKTGTIMTCSFDSYSWLFISMDLPWS